MNNKNFKHYLSENRALLQKTAYPPTQAITRMSPIYSSAECDAFRDWMRAALAKQIMENTAALSSLESYYLKLAPDGASEYRRIVKVYTELALAKLVDSVW